LFAAARNKSNVNCPMEKRIVRTHLQELNLDGLTLQGAILKLRNLIEQYPGIIVIEEDYDTSRLHLYEERYETDEECAARSAKEKEREQRELEWLDARLTALKAKLK